MNLRKLLHTAFCLISTFEAVTCLGLAPMPTAQADGISTGIILKLALPDLAIPTMSAGYSWENVEWIYVVNQGNLAAKASTLGVTWSSGRFTKLFTFPVKSLAPAEGVWIKVSLIGYSQVAPGTHMKYQADYFNAVFESNESNNEIDLNS